LPSKICRCLALVVVPDLAARLREHGVDQQKAALLRELARIELLLQQIANVEAERDVSIEADVVLASMPSTWRRKVVVGATPRM
jgi:hypothetical protein